MTDAQPPLPSRDDLPNLIRRMVEAGNVDALIAMIVRMVQTLDARHTASLLELQRQLRSARFSRKSEQLGAEQLEIFFDRMAETAQDGAPRAQQDFEVDEGQPRDEAKAQEKPARRPRPVRSFPPQLPREPLRIEVPAAQASCPQCGTACESIGALSSEILEYIPGQFKVIAVEREKLACRGCHSYVVTAQAADKVCERGAYGAGLISQVIVSKYNEHLPLYRQSALYKRQGVEIARSTLADLVGQSTRALEPLHEPLAGRVLQGAVIQTDDTGLRVLDRDGDRRAQRGHLWPYVSGNFACVDYTPTRSGEGPRRWLERYRGYIQVDGYSGYDALFKDCEVRVEVGCWMHARRPFYQALESGDARAEPMLAMIGSLYAIEAEAQRRGLDAERRAVLRQQRSWPIVHQIEFWMRAQDGSIPPKSPLGKAIAYLRNRWKALLVPFDHGFLELDTGRVERLIRGVAVGRRNYLFAGSDAGARRAALLYSLIWSARLHELDPWFYLKDVLEKIAGGWLHSRLAELLPDAWAQAHPQALRAARPA